MRPTVLLNCEVMTMRREEPIAEAVAFLGSKIISVGSEAKVLADAGKNAKIVDLDGKTVLPGFHDCHSHPIDFGLKISGAVLDLRSARSVDEILRAVRERAKQTPPGSWVVGQGWDTSIIGEGRPPNRWELDEASPNRPVYLADLGGHLAAVNSLALKLAGISKEAPPGGWVDVDADTGEPTGILGETAADRVSSLIAYGDEQLERALQLSLDEAVRNGITCLHAIARNSQEVRVFQKLWKQGRLPLRVYLMPRHHLWQHIKALGLVQGFGDNTLRIGAIKILMDGSIEGHTAALTEPYIGEPENTGVMWMSEKELLKIAKDVHDSGFQLAIHAIGDRTVHTVLKTLEKILSENPRRNHRHRIEHATLLDDEAIEKMAKLGVVASVQPVFIYGGSEWLIEALGEERAQ
ncbi:MAG: amidohydrolase, partial [Thermoprotei archaeon]